MTTPQEEPPHGSPPKQRPRWRRWALVTLLLLAVVAVLGGIKAAQLRSMIAAGRSATPPPESVTTARAEAARWRGQLGAVGSLVALHAVSLSTELAGTVRELRFESGAAVEKGALLVRLDTSTEEAQLAAAAAEAALARVTLARAAALRKSGAGTVADLDAADARAKQAAANVANLRAIIAKKVIRAPFSGRLGVRQVELGQILSPGTPIATLQSVDPILAEVWLGQQVLAQVHLGQAVRVLTDTFRDSQWDGTLTTINSEVDVATRTVRLRATVRNPDGRLRPGMFVNVEVLAEEERPVVIIPATAVIFAPFGDSVFVLEEQPGGRSEVKRARQRLVRLGERRGDLVEVVSGLRAGEPVVSSGAFKLKNGGPVVTNDELAPTAELEPRPDEQ